MAWDSLFGLRHFCRSRYNSIVYADARHSQAKWPLRPHLWQDEEDLLRVFCFGSYLGLWSLGLNLACLGGKRRWNPLGDRLGASDKLTSGVSLAIVAWISLAGLDSAFLSTICCCVSARNRADISLLCDLNFIFLYCQVIRLQAGGNVDKVLSMSWASVNSSPQSLSWAAIRKSSELNDLKSGNLSYGIEDYCKSTTMVDLRCSFINEGRLPRTCVLVRWVCLKWTLSLFQHM